MIYCVSTIFIGSREYLTDFGTFEREKLESRSDSVLKYNESLTYILLN